MDSYLTKPLKAQELWQILAEVTKVNKRLEIGLVGEICGLASHCGEESAELPARGVE